MKIFIDVNVFIDVMTKRQGWSESLRVLNLARRCQDIGSFTSALTVPLLYFFRRRVADESPARADIQAILKGVQLVPLNQTLLDHLITRNKKDFAASKLSVINPEEWLAFTEVVILEASLKPINTP